MTIDFSWCLTICCDLSMIYLLMRSKEIQNRLKMNSQNMGHFQKPAALRIVTHHFLQFPHRRRYLCTDISCGICDNIFSSIQIAYPPSYATMLISWQLSGSTLPPNMLDLGDKNSAETLQGIQCFGLIFLAKNSMPKKLLDMSGQISVPKPKCFRAFW